MMRPSRAGAGILGRLLSPKLSDKTNSDAFSSSLAAVAALATVSGLAAQKEGLPDTQQNLTVAFPKALTAAVTTSCDFDPVFHDEDDGSGYTEQERYDNCLSYHRSLLSEYRQKWDYRNVSSRLPTVSWPTNIPDAADVSGMLNDIKFCNRSPNYRNDEAYCDTTRFRVASYLLMQTDDAPRQRRGLKMMKDLAERGHPDGMCAYGICLNDGRAGLENHPKQAVVWWRRCVDMYDHAQSMYELGVALYTGEGVVEDEEGAVELFRRAAMMGHAGAAYMLGDCLLDGIGVEQDRGEALEWLVTAGELGHRGARSRVLAVLVGKKGADFGRFTDASRQSFVDSDRGKGRKDGDSNKKEQKESAVHVNIEKRFTIGGGTRNPVVLERRKSIVDESRTL